MIFRRVVLCLMLVTTGIAQESDQAHVETGQEIDQNGVKLAESGNLTAAIAEFAKAIQIQPDLAEAHYHLALSYDRARRTDEAMAEYEWSLWLDPNLTQARYLLAGCCRKRGDFQAELELLRQVTDRSPDFAEAHYNLGLALQTRERPTDAIEHLRAAVRLAAGNVTYLLALGVVLSEQDSGEAVGVLTKAIRLQPDNSDAHYDLAIASGKAGKLREAAREFETSLRIGPDRANIHRALGITLFHEDQLRQAAAQLSRAITLSPNDAEAANNLGLVQLRLGDIPEAIASLERAIGINPRLIKAHVTLAQAYQKAARAEDARRESRTAADLTSEQRGLGRAMLLLQTAQQRLAAGDIQRALGQLREAVRSSPGFAEANVRLGRALRESGSFDEALVVLKKACNLDPERADTHFEIGLTLQRMKREPEALAEFQATVDMAPCHVEARRQLGRAALKDGDRVKASEEFRAVLAAIPNDREAGNALRASKR